MDDKLRKKILEELNYLLNEDAPEQVEVGTTSAGNTSKALGIGAAAGGVAAGTAIATGVVGATTIGGAVLGASSIGATVGSVVPVVGTIVGVVVGALIGLAVGNIFRTAGYKEVRDDIKDAIGGGYLKSGNELANNLHTKSYIDLTAMEDATDEADFKSFMAAMKAIQVRFDNPRDEKEYGELYNQLYAEKDFYKKICDTGYFLLNEFGANDRMYYVKCAKLIFKKIPPQPKQETVKEAVETASPVKKEEPKKEEPKKEAPKCIDLQVIDLPVALIKLATEDEIEDAGVPLQNPVPEEIKGESPFTAQICNPSAAPKTDPEKKPEPAPSPVPGGGGTGKKQCVRCVNVKQGCSGKQVEEIQAKLNELGIKVSEKGTFGKETYNAVLNFQKSKGLKKVDGVVGPETCLAMGLTGSSATTKPSATSKFVDVNVKPQDLINLGFTGRFVKRDPAVSDSEMQKVSVDPEILTVLEKGKDYQPLEESKNFYDNIKLKQARLLYEKLIRKL